MFGAASAYIPAPESMSVGVGRVNSLPMQDVPPDILHYGMSLLILSYPEMVLGPFQADFFGPAD